MADVRKLAARKVVAIANEAVVEMMVNMDDPQGHPHVERDISPTFKLD